MMNNMNVVITKKVEPVPQRGVVTTRWIMRFDIEPDDYLETNIATGWTMCIDPRSQVQLKFSSKEKAIKFATKNRYKYSILEENANDKKVTLYHQYINNYK
ncbi:ETC complex I subunit conserved region [Candidatus Fokinia solitaria]|uniref:ETC complex I subunit conserved region n=1 Tax=Candidatus Fokinia solitaria TaxID=1802984 RepID=A0A2U8BRX0_9RICK|nr:NADH dehydrogenase ubiquinone Fe-S protein 4 [Candidatus Fokinia solitaria]AWD33020.1 ETC complex I subunit conserved region [Candidatus Fokinia solitaria]